MMDKYPGRSDLCGAIDDHLDCDGSSCTCPCHDAAYMRWLDEQVEEA